eukprot:TRINITY_DN836_c0_g2_i1.p1 TRINITY_DN836_c0_g2~~TRINITY_DN836_c0_g2_i1.p1  ORF type:complete len:617 (+),score=148.82 TRINITY_DN836_c0_g2_i1:60-1910(+)
MSDSGSHFTNDWSEEEDEDAPEVFQKSTGLLSPRPPKEPEPIVPLTPEPPKLPSPPKPPPAAPIPAAAAPAASTAPTPAQTPAPEPSADPGPDPGRDPSPASPAPSPAPAPASSPVAAPAAAEADPAAATPSARPTTPSAPADGSGSAVAEVVESPRPAGGEGEGAAEVASPLSAAGTARTVKSTPVTPRRPGPPTERSAAVQSPYSSMHSCSTSPPVAVRTAFEEHPECGFDEVFASKFKPEPTEEPPPMPRPSSRIAPRRRHPEPKLFLDPNPEQLRSRRRNWAQVRVCDRMREYNAASDPHCRGLFTKPQKRVQMAVAAELAKADNAAERRRREAGPALAWRLVVHNTYGSRRRGETPTGPPGAPTGRPVLAPGGPRRSRSAPPQWTVGAFAKIHTGSRWRDVRVVEVTGDKVRVHFSGHSTKHDKWVVTSDLHQRGGVEEPPHKVWIPAGKTSSRPKSSPARSRTSRRRRSKAGTVTNHREPQNDDRSPLSWSSSSRSSSRSSRSRSSSSRSSSRSSSSRSSSRSGSTRSSRQSGGSSLSYRSGGSLPSRRRTSATATATTVARRATADLPSIEEPAKEDERPAADEAEKSEKRSEDTGPDSDSDSYEDDFC